ncbi:MAG TPA: hypothetical protein PKD26_06860 [Pyrinomonadaceae bacterium]|mgnify:CR=1 FL=1|nr:hypothetical protein [Pyrinomonadaceae bacterium]
MPQKVRISSSAVSRSIPTEVGVKAAEIASDLAEANGIVCALAGGIAMHIYGFTRATTDVDLIASEKLPLTSKKKLTFGGESYRIKVGKREVQVDAIVRNDELTAIYQAALADALETDANVKIISPEWMAILKHLAGRAKDKLDLIWLLQQDGLVNRKRIQKNLVKAIGKQSAFFVYEEMKSEFDYADFLKMRERAK